ncbi:hypothetical protein SpCBS45565_g02729 [Spizellomyces sp. 'palustris']|nr:hypothetical protein SpCBS45565_g02729 [Spizellomyces sp. 'palustris']
MTIVTSNDVVVLTITPIVCYLTQETKTDPKAYLVSTFIVCNVASLALYIGNPTNIIVAQAFRINFIQYSAWMGLPTLLAVGLAYLMCFVVLRSHIPVHIPSPPPEAEERYQIRDRWGAFIGCAVLLACLLGLMIVPIFADVPVWMLTLPFGAIMIGKDMIMDLTRNCRPQKTEHENIELGTGVTSEVRMLRRESSNEQDVSLSSESVENKECLIGSKDASTEDKFSVEMGGTHSGPTKSVRTERNSVAFSSCRVPTPSRSRRGSRQGSSLAVVEIGDGSHPLVEDSAPKKLSIVSRMSACSDALPTVYHVTVRLPWKLIPFALGMFILCESLSANGWTSLLAKGMAHLSVGGHMIPMVFFTGLVTTVACNVLNNLPMTILFARVFSHPDFDATILSIISSSEADSTRVVYALRRGGMFALIIGSNFGGNLTYLGALAGLMWDDLLRKRGMGIKQTQFFIWCTIITPVVLFGALAVLVAEFAVQGYYI